MQKVFCGEISYRSVVWRSVESFIADVTLWSGVSDGAVVTLDFVAGRREHVDVAGDDVARTMTWLTIIYVNISHRLWRCVHVQCESKNFIPPCVFLNFFPTVENFKQSFTRLLYVHIYAKLPNFIHLSLNLTKLSLVAGALPLLLLLMYQKCSFSRIYRPSAMILFLNFTASAVRRP